jgi:hypothetical protein
MTDINETTQDDDKPVSGWQTFYDSEGILLFIGIVSPAVFYLLWGVMEIVTVPIAGY